MLPFDSYPDKGRKLFGLPRGSNCRQEYGLRFMQITGEKHCAYCHVDFTKFETWLTMVLDHVIRVSAWKSMGVPDEWGGDYANTVLACGTCNGFCNRYMPGSDIVRPVTLEEFFDRRDEIFEKRKQLISARRESERQFFEKKKWEIRSSGD